MITTFGRILRNTHFYLFPNNSNKTIYERNTTIINFAHLIFEIKHYVKFTVKNCFCLLIKTIKV